jgi:His-Xaa-Ser system protein HxsD
LAELRLPKATYQFDTLVRVAHRLGRIFSIDIKPDGDDWLLTWKASPELTEESIERIRNEVYEQIIRDKIHDETKPIRDLIFAAAFSNIELE